MASMLERDFGTAHAVDEPPIRSGLRSPFANVDTGPSFFAMFYVFGCCLMRGGLLQVLNNSKPYLDCCERTVLRLCLHEKRVEL